MIIVYSIIGFLGLILGTIFRKKFKEEVNEKIFWIIKVALLLIITGILSFEFENHWFFIGIILGFMLYFIIKNLYFYLGFIFLLENAALLSGLIFIFGLFDNFKFKHLLYFLPLGLLFFDMNINLILGFIIGGMLNYVRNYKKSEK